MAAKRRISDEQYRDAAEAKYGCEGGRAIEIDDNAAVSRGGDPGAYVQAWVWVADDDVPPRKRKPAP